MTIVLRIENVDQLPDGGPLEYRAARRNVVIGRDTFLDWTLPDPSRIVSGRHAEITYADGSYLLRDVSRNGTFVNGAEQRVKSPYRLRNGDRLAIGDYIVLVTLRARSSRSPSIPTRRPPPRPGRRRPSTTSGTPTSPALPPSPGPISISAAPPARATRIRRRPSSICPPRRRRWTGAAGIPVPLRHRRRSRARGTPARRPCRRKAKASTFRPPPPARRRPAPEPDERPAQRPQPQARPSMEAPPTRSAPGERSSKDGAAIAAFARGAGIPPDALGQRSPAEIMEEAGAALRAAVEGLSGLLRARSAAKSLVRSSERTTIARDGNNPLKFMPDPGQIIASTLSGGRAGFLDLETSIASSVDDLRRHQMATYSALQVALVRAFADLAPETIESKVKAAPFGLGKGKAWDTYVTLWDAKVGASDDGLLGLFLQHFATAYDEAVRGAARKPDDPG